MRIITTARGATTTFSYNNRRLVIGITYGVPAGLAATPNVTFGYDGAGNRTSMTDGLGSVSYGYDQLFVDEIRDTYLQRRRFVPVER
jgi:hypothetical protein